MLFFKSKKEKSDKSEIISTNNQESTSIVEVANELLIEARTDISADNALKIPLSSMTTMGGGIASILPTIEKIVSNKSSSPTKTGDKFYKLVNKGVTDNLKQAKDGNYWGALKTAEGKSKMLKLKEVDGSSLSVPQPTAFNPAMIMMAAALYSINKKLDTIQEQQEEILSFLIDDKEAQIRSDVTNLTDVIEKYKLNWEDNLFRSTHLGRTLQIHDRAEHNIELYKTTLEKTLKKDNGIVFSATVKDVNAKTQKQLKYYKLSHYIYALSSFVEVMLQGNFSEENLLLYKRKINQYALQYDEMYERCSAYVQSVADKCVEKNLLKGIGNISSATGKALGGLAFVKEGTVDKWFQDVGENLKNDAAKITDKAVESFSNISDSGMKLFEDKFEDMINIYNHTSDICFDGDYLYLLNEI